MIKGLLRNGINSNLNKWRDTALYYVEAAGKFDAACCEWEQKLAVDKTWKNIKTFISEEYAMEDKQNKLTAKHFKVNIIQEQVETTEEPITTLMETHSHLMETLIKSTLVAMKEMMLQIKKSKIPPIPTIRQMRRRKRKETKSTKSTMTHQSANTAAINTRQKPKMNAGI